MGHHTRSVVAIALLAISSAASAAIPFTAVVPPSGNNNAFPAQNLLGPTGTAVQQNYPYPGQCLADSTNAALFPLLAAKSCGTTGSFACMPSGAAPRSAGGWAACGVTQTFTPLNPMIPSSVPPAGTLATPKFVYAVLNPPDYTPDKNTFDPVTGATTHVGTFPGAEYYEIGLHEAWGFQSLAAAGLFPTPPANYPIPNGMQWTGLICTIPGGCSCPAGISANFKNEFCPTGKIPQGAPLPTPIWGVGQINSGGGPVTSALRVVLGTCSVGGTLCDVRAGLPTPPPPFPGTKPCPAPAVCTAFFAPGTPSEWSDNSYVATWPSISIRGTRGTPVVVKWTNEFPNNHVFCPHPEAADFPCAIDRTFMGVKARIDPSAANGIVPPDGVNLYGSPQQPDNSWVTHLHGGEIPPSTDGFAEKWFGNKVTAPAYSGVNQNFVNPPFEAPEFSPAKALKRPAGVNTDTYTYPMVQEEALIWFHDHTLGKTHHNVIAGPAGFFPVKDPSKHYPIVGGVCTAPKGAACPYPAAWAAPGKAEACDCSYSWLDPVTEPRNVLGVPLYDMFLAIQDRSFNDDGSINFSNGLGQTFVAGPLLPVGYNSITAGVNPQVHPVWVPEYFGDHVLVNGVLWPFANVSPGWYRIRMADGADSRCWTVGFTSLATPPGKAPSNNVPFWVLANDQGYLKAPVPAPAAGFTMCPGERYELLVNFAGLANVWMTNTAPAPFPAGVTPMAAKSPYAEMNTIMQFKVNQPGGVPSCTATITTNCMPANPALQVDPMYQDIRPLMPFPRGTIVRQVYLNERADGITLSPMGMQLNGVPFEYKVTETPKEGSREVWQFVNLTVDAHPMHPHLVKHQIVARQSFNVGAYKAALCGSSTCQPGPAPGGEMQAVPDVTPFLSGNPTLVTPASVEGGWKDASQALPGMVTTIVADWTARWPVSATPNAPGTAGCPAGTPNCPAPYTYESVQSGPYVWHCHINSHEDSEMMRTSLVVKATP